MMMSKTVAYYVKTFAADGTKDDDDKDLVTEEDLIAFYEKHDSEKVEDVGEFLRYAIVYCHTFGLVMTLCCV